MESIMQSDNEKCYMCKRFITKGTRHKHHALHGTANRRLADEDGLFVYLCYDCHEGTAGAHGKNGAAVDSYLKMQGQLAWEHQYAVNAFRARYGKNFL